jgi:hypothetical protein
MEFIDLENWRQIILIVIGLLVLWGLAGLVLKLARRVISCGCSLIVAIALLYILLRWISTLR